MFNPRLMLLALGLCSWAPAQTPLHKLFEDYFEFKVRSSPALATSLGRPEFDHLWDDLSLQNLARERKELEEFRIRFDAVPESGLNQQDRLSLQLARYEVKETLEQFDANTYLLSVSQLFGLHTAPILTLSAMPARTVRQAENIVARLRAIPAYVDQCIALMDEAIRRGQVQPKLVAELVIKQLAVQADMPAETAPALLPMRSLSHEVPEADRTRLQAAAAQAYREAFVPAWKKLHRYMNEVYLPKARAETAVSALPGGKELYASLVPAPPTTRMTPEQIHELGLSEVKRIEGEMEKIIRSTGFNGSLNEYDRRLASDPSNLFRTKEEILIYCRDVAMRAAPELPKLFKRLPRMPFGIRTIPEDREAQTASNYNAPAADGSRAGWFNLNAYQPEKQVKHTKDALTLHEGVPGHHLQLALQREIEGLPEFRKIYRVTAYSEGWGLYAESLGVEMGVYNTPLRLLGRYNSERFRAVRLVVDTGLHALGWSRAKALDYFITHSPTSSVAEIDRYIAMPAQALAYKIGELKFTELRRLAQRELGPKFDIREFHEVLIGGGAMPLDIVESQVKEWIQRQRN